MAILTPSAATYAEASRHLLAGGLVGMPTETVYGLAGDASNGRAVASIYEAKGRPAFNPLIIHVATLAAAETLAQFDRRAKYVAQRCWPGPLTLVLPRRPRDGISDLAMAGLSTIAIRIPDHPVALGLLSAAARPLAAPSANRSGRISPTTPQHVEDSLGERLAIILDGGPCRIGVESTILDLTGEPARLLRPGGVAVETLEAAIGEIANGPGQATNRPTAPGQLLSHYAPRLPVRLDATAPRADDEALLAFGANPPPGFAAMLNLSPAGDLHEAAANLFAYLHQLDQPRFSGIAAMPIPARGLGLAIRDRLTRAAAPRP